MKPQLLSYSAEMVDGWERKRHPVQGGLFSRCRGFSLVEVTLAMGIVSFALMALLGIVSIGLIAAQEAMRQTARSHIIHQISSDLGQISFSELDTYLAAPQYFDYDGKRLEQEFGAIFIADLTKVAPAYPGSASLSQLRTRLEHITVSIRRPSESNDTAFRSTLSVFNSSRLP